MDNNSDEEAYCLNEPFNLSAAERDRLHKIADKDGDAAYRLAMYYGFYLGDLEQWQYWQKVAAGLGHSVAIYDTANALFYRYDQYVRFGSRSADAAELNQQRLSQLLTDAERWALLAVDKNVAEAAGLLQEIREAQRALANGGIL